MGTPNMIPAIILQTRLDSSRLPRKALADLCGRALVVRVMQALKSIDTAAAAANYILACPHDSYDELKDLTVQCGFEIFAGSKNDVLSRYCDAIRYFELDKNKSNWIIRATGDNPFVFADAAQAIYNKAQDSNADYACYMQLPYGAGVEVVNVGALLKANELAVSGYDREHVCPFLYNNRSLFNIHQSNAPECWNAPNLRITVDEPSDLQKAVQLYEILNKQSDQKSRYNGKTIIDAAAAI
ncbi:MAG: hypothetical protein Ta2F_11420 [Termitinemataceae bacterium]|nr:MAG: hypothetical protein Ta2F_11420 [Termitinemataceae bacterium]